LNRFFSLHFLLPFIIAGLSIIHIFLLHLEGSSSVVGSESINYITFYPYFYLKDLVSFLVFLWVLLFLVFFYPNLLSDPYNYIKSNPLVTPPHIVPEWYFLFFYAILRTIPNKLLCVLYLVISLLVIFIIPFILKCNLRANITNKKHQVSH